MPAERMEIIFETSERFPGRIAFDVSIRDARYIDHKNAGTAKRTKLAFDIMMTADREGYRFIAGKKDAEGEQIRIQRFMSAYPHAAADPRPIVDAFRDQGYDVVCRGSYKAGKVLSWEEYCAMDFHEHAQADREEAAYAAGRAAERAGRDAASILRLQAAALAEEAPVTTQFQSQDQRDAFRVMQAQLRDQETGHKVSEEEEQRAVFAA